jgi:protein-disulfide isomerase
MKAYPDDVRVAYMMHPLPMHSHAAEAAEAAMAAHAQGKFKEMHAKLEANSSSLSRDKILQFAKELNLDMERFTHDLDTNAHKAEIDRQTQEVMKIGATGTPATFINGRYLSGAQPYESFKKLVDEELAKAGGAAAPAPSASTASDGGKEASKGPEKPAAKDPGN